MKTKLGTQDVAQFTVDNIIKCLKDNGHGELPEELGQVALDNHFDMRQGKAESNQDYIFREEILTVALQKDTAIHLDEKNSRILADENVESHGTRNFRNQDNHSGADTARASQKKPSPRRLLQRNVRKSGMISVRQETERETALCGYAEVPNFNLHGNSDDDQADTISESESNCSEQGYELDGQEQEALISLRDARKKLQHATKSRRFYPTGGGPCKEHRKIYR